MELSTIGALVSVLVASATFFIGRLSASNTAGKEAGTLATDIKYIKESIARIERRYDTDIHRLELRGEELHMQLAGLGQDAAKAGELARSAHQRLDEHILREHPVGKGGSL